MWDNNRRRRNLRGAEPRASFTNMAKRSIGEATAESRHEAAGVRFDVESELWPIDRVKPYAKNAKRHPPEQLAHLAKLFKRHGFNQPIVVDRKGVIAKGHGRWMAAKQLGLARVPVVVSEAEPAMIAEMRIADNRVAEHGWDLDALVADVVSGLKLGVDVEITGFTLEQLGLDLGKNAEGAPLDGPDGVSDPEDGPKNDEIDLGEGEHTCPRCGFNFGPRIDEGEDAGAEDERDGAGARPEGRAAQARPAARRKRSEAPGHA